MEDRNLRKFTNFCAEGNLPEVEKMIALGHNFHLLHKEILYWTIRDGRHDVASYLLKRGASVLNYFPDFLHKELYNFHEATFYGELGDDIEDNLKEDSFIDTASFMRAFGYPINIMIPATSSFGQGSDTFIHIGKTELELAIIYGHIDAVLYLRMTGGRRSKELLHPMGGFTFLNTDEDKFLLKILILYEQEQIEPAFNLLRNANEISLSKLALIAIINSYSELQVVLMEVSPTEFVACNQVLSEYKAKSQQYLREENNLTGTFFKIAEEFNVDLFRLIFGMLKNAESKQYLIEVCIDPYATSTESESENTVEAEQDAHGDCTTKEVENSPDHFYLAVLKAGLNDSQTLKKAWELLPFARERAKEAETRKQLKWLQEKYRAAANSAH